MAKRKSDRGTSKRAGAGDPTHLRHDLFVALVARGFSAYEAYCRCGYSPNHGNASKLRDLLWDRIEAARTVQALGPGSPEDQMQEVFEGEPVTAEFVDCDAETDNGQEEKPNGGEPWDVDRWKRETQSLYEICLRCGDFKGALVALNMIGTAVGAFRAPKEGNQDLPVFRFPSMDQLKNEPDQVPDGKQQTESRISGEADGIESTSERERTVGNEPGSDRTEIAARSGDEGVSGSGNEAERSGKRKRAPKGGVSSRSEAGNGNDGSGRDNPLWWMDSGNSS